MKQLSSKWITHRTIQKRKRFWFWVYKTQSPNTSIISLAIHTQWLPHFVGNGWQTSLFRTKHTEKEREREREIYTRSDLLCCCRTVCCVLYCVHRAQKPFECVFEVINDNRLDIIITIECFSVWFECDTRLKHWNGNAIHTASSEYN